MDIIKSYMCIKFVQWTWIDMLANAAQVHRDLLLLQDYLLTASLLGSTREMISDHKFWFHTPRTPFLPSCVVVRLAL